MIFKVFGKRYLWTPTEWQEGLACFILFILMGVSDVNF